VNKQRRAPGRLYFAPLETYRGRMMLPHLKKKAPVISTGA
jgi:hypothetical protein